MNRNFKNFLVFLIVKILTNKIIFSPQKISSSVEMKDNATNYVKISYYSKCKDGTVLSQTNKCDDLRVGDLIEFQAEIVVTKCPENPEEWNQVIQVNFPSFLLNSSKIYFFPDLPRGNQRKFGDRFGNSL